MAPLPCMRGDNNIHRGVTHENLIFINILEKHDLERRRGLSSKYCGFITGGRDIVGWK